MPIEVKREFNGRFSLVDTRTGEYLMFNDKYIWDSYEHLEYHLTHSECTDSAANKNYYLIKAKEYLER